MTDDDFPPDFTPEMKEAAKALLRLNKDQFRYVVALQKQRVRRERRAAPKGDIEAEMGALDERQHSVEALPELQPEVKHDPDA